MKKITVDDREFKVTGNPEMGVVRYVQDMEIEIMREYLDDDVILEMESVDRDDIGAMILEDADIEDMKGILWNRSMQEPLQTICLATNEKLSVSDIESMKALDYRELKEASEDALGGSATDFIESLGVGISSQVKEIQKQLEETGEIESSEDLPPTVSDLSS